MLSIAFQKQICDDVHDLIHEVWEKLVGNAFANCVSALTGATASQIFAELPENFQKHDQSDANKSDSQTSAIQLQKPVDLFYEIFKVFKKFLFFCSFFLYTNFRCTYINGCYPLSIFS